MENITNVSASTRMDGNADKVVTAITIDWAGMTPEEIRAMAQQGLIIKLQSQWRRNAKKGTAIPTTAKVNAVDHRVGVRAVKVEKPLIEQLMELSPDERAALLAQVTA